MMRARRAHALEMRRQRHDASPGPMSPFSTLASRTAGRALPGITGRIAPADGLHEPFLTFPRQASLLHYADAGRVIYGISFGPIGWRDADDINIDDARAIPVEIPRRRHLVLFIF